MRRVQDVPLDVPSERLEGGAHHPLAALHPAAAVFDEALGHLADRDFVGLRAERARLELTLHLDPEGVGLAPGVELPAVAVARAVHEVDHPGRAGLALAGGPVTLPDRGHDSGR